MENTAVPAASLVSRRAAVRLGGGALAAGGLLAAPARRGLAGHGAGHAVFFGWVLGAPSPTAAAVELGAPDEAGERPIRAYVCDGYGFPDGVALWFKGTLPAREAEGAHGVLLATPGGGESLRVTHSSDFAVTGAFTDAAGAARVFVAGPATAGAGIYDVIVDEDLRYKGASTDGSVLEAQATPDGKVTGAIATAGGTVVPFAVRVLALLPEEELAGHGLPPRYRDFAEVGLVPDAYVALAAPGGVMWLGRSGDVRGGKAGNNIIGLDYGET